MLVNSAPFVKLEIAATRVEDADGLGVLQLENDMGGSLPGSGECCDCVAAERKLVGDALRDAAERAVVEEEAVAKGDGHGGQHDSAATWARAELLPSDA